MDGACQLKEFFAYREFPRRRGTPIFKIEILERVKHGKRRIRFAEGPKTGREEIVQAETIIIEWPKAEAYLRDEKCLLKLVEKSNPQWSHDPDDPIVDAVNLVFMSTGEDEPILDSSGPDAGTAHMPYEAAKRILARARIPGDPLDLDPLAFVDNDGELNIPFEIAVNLAQAFAAAEPDTVLVTADAQQSKWEQELTGPSQVSLLQKWRVGWILARQWANGGAAVTNRSLHKMRHNLQNGWEELWKKFGEIEKHSREENQRLRSLVLEAAEMLRSVKAEKAADRVLLKLNQPSKSRLKGSDCSIKK
jgi:hypothetical protein